MTQAPPASTTATPLSPEFVARALLRGFDRHYQLFRAVSAEAKARFEAQDWQGQQRAQRERIAFYDQRVEENVAFLRESYDAAQLSAEFWQQIKLHFIGMLINHRQPELAETFFNSVTTQILHRTYFQNDFIFVRPAISTEYLEVSNGELPTYWAVYPQRDTLATALRELILGFGLKVPFAHLDRDVQRMVSVLSRHIDTQRLRANFQIRVLSSLFFRNKGAYAVGRLINGFQELPFAFALLFNSQGQIFIDALLYGEDDLLMLFSFARAYFMVDTEVPSAMVQFLCSMMPRKPRSEFYNALGLAKQGKTLFFRDYLAHITHSSDRFRIAPGIKGMVMLVFDLPSFPFVFKVIKDYYPPQKDTTREQIRGKYLLVKQHDRVGRMADTLEFSNVAFPYARFDPDLIAEIQKFAPSQLEISDRDGDGEIEVILQHVYIERRMIPLNIYLQEACAALQKNAADTRARRQMETAVIDYGNAIKDLIAANIFPGDMLWKNFGITRHGKVVFYDYDEIEYITDCNFRKVPAPRNEEDEMSGEIWYKVGPRDVFPETFAPFLLGHAMVRDVFMSHHADLLDPDYWQAHKDRILAGELQDVFPYDQERRLA